MLIKHYTLRHSWGFTIVHPRRWGVPLMAIGLYWACPAYLLPTDIACRGFRGNCRPTSYQHLKSDTGQ